MGLLRRHTPVESTIEDAKKQLTAAKVRQNRINQVLAKTTEILQENNLGPDIAKALEIK